MGGIPPDRPGVAPASSSIEKLRNQQQWLEVLLDLLPLPTLFIEPRTARVTFANRAANAMAGGSLPLAQNAEEYARYYACTDREGNPLTVEQMPGTRVANGEAVSGDEIVWVTNGEERSVIVTADTVPGLFEHEPVCLLMMQDVTGMKHVEDELRKKNEEIEALNQRLQRAIAETHHRVKNNLQVISALIDIQLSEDAPTIPKSEVERLGQHVRALATVHELLTYETKTGGIVATLSVREMLNRLAPSLRGILGDRPISYRIDDVRLSVKHTTSLAALVNELVSNAVKHGEGEIEVVFTISEGRGHLIVTDRGPGFPQEFSTAIVAQTGMELIESLSQWDLGGEVAYRNHEDGGAEVEISFPVTAAESAG
jgi:two-component sensor histidine kinase